MKAVILGAGYWGGKIIKTLEEIPSVNIVGIYDKNINSLQEYRNKYPTFTEHCNLFKTEHDIQFIITRADSHFLLSKIALENNKHVFVEKPMALNSLESQKLVDLSLTYKKVLCVDHTFLFSPEVNFFKNYIINNNSPIKFFESKRVNNGPFMTDINVVFDLSPHDISILNHIIPYKPYGVSANGISIINDIVEKCQMTIFYKDTDFKAFIDVSWLEQNKLREIRIIDRGGFESKHESTKDKILTFNKYNNSCLKTVDLNSTKSPLYHELTYFIDCIKNNITKNIIDGNKGSDVIKIIEAANLSIKNNGEMIKI